MTSTSTLSPATANHPLRVVVVDASRDVQRNLAALISGTPDVQIVGFAEDTAGALATVSRVQPDVVVVDLELRGNSRGFDVLRWIVREHPHIKVIVLSNFNWSAIRNGFLDAGAYAYFDKRVDCVKARDCIAALAATSLKSAGGGGAATTVSRLAIHDRLTPGLS